MSCFSKAIHPTLHMFLFSHHFPPFPSFRPKNQAPQQNVIALENFEWFASNGRALRCSDEEGKEDQVSSDPESRWGSQISKLPAFGQIIATSETFPPFGHPLNLEWWNLSELPPSMMVKAPSTCFCDVW